MKAIRPLLIFLLAALLGCRAAPAPTPTAETTHAYPETQTAPPADTPQPTATEIPPALSILAALDDHYDILPDRYKLTVKLNGTLIFSGKTMLEHGTPSGGEFDNFSNLTIPLNLNLLNEGANELILTLTV
jgi:hypothetical protein